LLSSNRPWEAALPEFKLEDHHLQALGSMGSTCFAHPEDLLDQGLNLLVRQLGVEWATVASRTGKGLENLWFAGGSAQAGIGVRLSRDPNRNFCPQVLEGVGATLAIADAAQDPHWAKHPGWRELGVRAYLGVLSVQDSAPRAWQGPDIALVEAMAALFGKTMEVEALKVKLWQAQEALDLSSAVLEDHAMESLDSGLPSRRYLELWCKSNLRSARRRRELITLVTWAMPATPDRNRLLGRLSGSLRGVDLLVDLGRDQFLLVFPRTPRAGADTALARLRRILGPVPMGATLWNPLLRPDCDDPTLQPAIRRAQRAVPEGLEGCQREADDGEVVWSLLESSRENLLDGAGQW